MRAVQIWTMSGLLLALGAPTFSQDAPPAPAAAKTKTVAAKVQQKQGDSSHAGQVPWGYDVVCSVLLTAPGKTYKEKLKNTLGEQMAATTKMAFLLKTDRVLVDGFAWRRFPKFGPGRFHVFVPILVDAQLTVTLNGKKIWSRKHNGENILSPELRVSDGSGKPSQLQISVGGGRLPGFGGVADIVILRARKNVDFLGKLGTLKVKRIAISMANLTKRAALERAEHIGRKGIDRLDKLVIWGAKHPDALPCTAMLTKPHPKAEFLDKLGSRPVSETDGVLPITEGTVLRQIKVRWCHYRCFSVAVDQGKKVIAVKLKKVDVLGVATACFASCVQQKVTQPVTTLGTIHLPPQEFADKDNVFVIVRTEALFPGRVNLSEFRLCDAASGNGVLLGCGMNKDTLSPSYYYPSKSITGFTAGMMTVLLVYRMPRSYAMPLALSYMGRKEPVRVMTNIEWKAACLSNASASVRQDAAEALGQEKEQTGAAMAALKQALLKERDPKTRTVIEKALKELSARKKSP